MPMFGQKSKQEKLIAGMAGLMSHRPHRTSNCIIVLTRFAPFFADEFYAVMKKHRLPQGDFPNIARFQVRPPLWVSVPAMIITAKCAKLCMGFRRRCLLRSTLASFGS